MRSWRKTHQIEIGRVMIVQIINSHLRSISMKVRLIVSKAELTSSLQDH